MSEKGYELTESRYNVFIKQSFYRMQYRPPDNCTIEHIVRMNPAELEKHLERTFYERYGISTQKYIRYFGDSKLCIDHITPLRYAETIEDVKRLCCYSNLQLLITRDNIVKERGVDIWKNHADLKTEIESYEHHEKALQEIDEIIRWSIDHD